MAVLLHICCAPCSVECIDALREEGSELCGYWYNPNIQPYAEYRMRRDTLIEYAKRVDLPLELADGYDLRAWVNMLPNLDDRCGACYASRLDRAAAYAAEHGFEAYSTTLLISPYQRHDLIREIGERIGRKHGVEFLYRDFRPRFRRGQYRAREMGLYMQKYCGCVFSEEEAALRKEHSAQKLPEGFEFLPAEPDVTISKERKDKHRYIGLLLEADPSEKLVEKYLDEGELFVLRYRGEAASAAVTVRVDDETVELKNLVTVERFRGRGYAGRLIKYLADNYKPRFRRMLVGTTENNIPFYVKHGFDRYEKTVKNFFTENYDGEIFDGELKCEDLYYYSRKLS